ncbi:hypothetical protein [Nonlabens sp.]|uniref:hypothetical protein n=1 Tax=Nonlabens sp. TaxID=1888209 RepID=UPI001BCBEADC|nr:hypothetical protein [Nonlabens sp.]
MKKITLIIGFFLFNYVLFAQNNQGKADDAGRIALASVVSDQIEGLTPSAQSNLQNKLNRIATKNGMGGSSLNNRFIITANVVILTKDITPTAPPMQAYTLEITLYIGDGVEGTLFSSTSVTLKGVGKTETKAYMAALKNLKVSDPKYQSFIEQGKNKIIEYYNSKCDFILKEADALVSQNEFDAAIAKLVSIPEVCKDCFDKAMDKVGPIYQQQIDRQCKVDLAEAKNVWNANLDGTGASKASNYLGNIDPNSSCYNEALNFSNVIAKRIKELDQREWDFKLKQQQDDVDIQKSTIKAARDIGVAYGENQPQNIQYNYRGWY